MGGTNNTQQSAELIDLRPLLASRPSRRECAATYLTERIVAALSHTRADHEPQFTWDAKIVGLGVRQTSSGHKSYVLRYRVHGRQRLATLGAVRIRSLDEVRKKARSWLAQASDGTDPKFAEGHAQQIGTLRATWACYMHERISRKSARSKADLDQLWRLHIAKPFGAIPVADITQAQVDTWHRQLTASRGPYAANRAVAALRAAINWQIKRHRHTLPVGFMNQCYGVEPNPELPRRVILRPRELPQLKAAIDRYPDPVARAFFWVALCTGARKSELLGLTWQHVNFESREIFFPDTKNGVPHSVPVAMEALQALKGLPRYEGNPYVFPARHGEGQRINVSKAWRKIRAEAGLPHLRIHDLRRSVGSWLGANGWTAQAIGALLNHKSDITSRTYMHLGDLDVKRELVIAHSRLLKKALKQHKP